MLVYSQGMIDSVVDIPKISEVAAIPFPYDANPEIRTDSMFYLVGNLVGFDTLKDEVRINIPSDKVDSGENLSFSIDNFTPEAISYTLEFSGFEAISLLEAETSFYTEPYFTKDHKIRMGDVFSVVSPITIVVRSLSGDVIATKTKNIKPN